MNLDLPSHEKAKPCSLENLRDIPKLPGCYAIWSGDVLVYVGEAGSRWTKEKPKTSHINRRLSDHIRGTRSDVFPVYVFERFVLKTLTSSEINSISEGKESISGLSKKYVQNNFSFTYVTTEVHSDAKETENYYRKGGFGSKPIINPLN
tara:strand:+ start:955 stop:1401 length:447 start_codon:yes stop_codon:yes gene_type:complete